ncbi:pentapeptide repeats family protein [Collimonas fungivorans]|uniref:Pentapeptide repeats family protein n=1 Tax=Collimonas fungivorans TaxID=158899 RepID=A0A127P8J4_9BURK|nr:pentapeptide repeat-containing protein [Collimonas fungivorans]AMO94078.1 pentapeptide repeats family protein [Collimonas fungivorans]
MTTRRRFLSAALGAAVFPILTGCKNMNKQNIRTFGKTFDYLKDPMLRQKEVGDVLLTVQNAEFSGEKFEGMEWRNIRFINCDFAGAYEIAPRKLTDAKFEDCRFTGILSYGVTDNVQFLHCSWTGQSVMYGERGSKNTLFQECQFFGPDADKNHWGGVGTDGEAEFVKCKAKWFGFSGQTKLSIRDCEFEDSEIDTDSFGNSGENFLSSAVLIENSKLRGKFEIISRQLQSLIIRNTALDHIDLSNSTVKGDVLIEGLEAGFVDALFDKAASLTIRSSKVNGNGRDVFQTSPAGIVRIDIDGVTFGKGEEPVFIGGGFSNKQEIARVNQYLRLHNCKIPVLASNHLNTENLILDTCAIQEASFKESRISRLDIKNTKILERLDFTNTQVETQDLTTLAPYKGRVDKLDGSNVKLPG